MATIAESDSIFACLGDVMVDIVATLSSDIRPGTDTPSTNSISGGGAAANTAAWLGVSGARSVMIGCVGSDALGSTAIAELQHSNVRTEIARSKQVPTGTVIALVHPDGERTMFPDAGANLELDSDHVVSVLDTLSAEAPARHLHVSGYTLMREPTRAVAQLGISRARERGFTVSIDAASVGPMLDVGLDTVRTLFAGFDVLFANADEALALAGTAEVIDAAQWLTRLAPHVVVKRGASGAMWADANGNLRHYSPLAVEVVDTLGAGDAFAAGALPAWKSGLLADDVLAAGAVVAAQCVTRAGARPTGAGD